MLHEFALHQQLISGAVGQPIDALNLRQWTDANRRRSSGRSASY
jgi:hypothetical protein